ARTGGSGMIKRNWLLIAIAAAVLATVFLGAPQVARADDDDDVAGVALDADGDGRWDDNNGDGEPDRTTRKSWKDLAKCGLRRGSTVSFGGWYVAAAAAFTCLLD